MKEHFSRLTFDPEKNFKQVLMRQGQVLLDAEWNEQGEILLHYLKALAKDLIGSHGGPDLNDEGGPGGFTVLNAASGEDKFDLRFSGGRYYVEGNLVECPKKWKGKAVSLFNQPYLRLPQRKSDADFLIYLDVWERHITSYEDPGLLEVALGGIPTSSRVQTVFQIKTFDLPPSPAGAARECIVPPKLARKRNALLRAHTVKAETSADPCNIEADAHYRGLENHLIRVEVHRGNVNANGERDPEAIPTFCFSRENASVVFQIVDIDTGEKNKVTVELANLGRDESLGLREGDVVEIVDDDQVLENRAESLLRVIDIDKDEGLVTLEGETSVKMVKNGENHPLLRRWDQKAGASFKYKDGLPIEEVSETSATWTKLEDGIEIQFVKRASVETVYYTGDYWVFPARTAIKDIEWPIDDNGNPALRPPRGIVHSYAPLAIISGAGAIVRRCRNCINPPRHDCPQPSGLAEKTIATGQIELSVNDAAAKATQARSSKKTKTAPK